MARRKAIVIETGEGLCGDGCKAPVARTYKQGHDARLRSKLLEAHREGAPVAFVIDGTKTTKPAADWLTERGWPVPAKV